MATARLGKLLKTLPHSLALLGLAIILLWFFNQFFLMGPRQEPTGAYSAALPRAATDRLIERLQDRLKTYPTDQEGYIQLGAAYLQKARETGDASHYDRAEEALREALNLKPDSLSAVNLMGAVALGRHQFQEALDWAGRALRFDPESARAYGVLGDAQVELGQYDAGFQSFQSMVDLKPDLGSYARASYARQLTGGADGAIEAMKMAVAAGPPRSESTAWALAELGHLYFNGGRLDEAATSYESALKTFDGYYPALAGLGKVRAAQGRYDEAIKLYEGAVAIIPQPAFLAALGDLHARTGNKAQAQLQYDTVEVIARLAAINQVIYNRELVYFYADHDIKLDEALALARSELAVRQDIYGYDALAWALYKNGRFDEAREAMAEALKLGTQDPNLFYHAGMVYYRQGRLQAAREHLERALALNPHFSLLHADKAREALAKLQEATSRPGDSS